MKAEKAKKCANFERKRTKKSKDRETISGNSVFVEQFLNIIRLRRIWFDRKNPRSRFDSMRRTYFLNNILIVDSFENTFFTCLLNFAAENEFIEDEIRFFKVKDNIQFTNLNTIRVLISRKQRRLKSNLHFRNIYRAIRRNDELSPKLTIHYHLVQFHNKNINLHI